MATIIPSYKKINPYQSIKDNDLIGLTFSDTEGPASNVLWSSELIMSKLRDLEQKTASVQKIDPEPTDKFQTKLPGSQGLAKFDDLGQVISSGANLDDSAAPHPNIIWSSARIAALPLPPFQLKQANAQSGNIATFGVEDVGQVADSGLKVDDSQESNTVLWTSQKIVSVLNEKVASIPQQPAVPQQPTVVAQPPVEKPEKVKRIAKFVSSGQTLLQANGKVLFPQQEFNSLGDSPISISDGTVLLKTAEKTLFKLSFYGERVGTLINSKALLRFFDETQSQFVGAVSSLLSSTHLVSFVALEPGQVKQISIKAISSDPSVMLENAYILIEEI